MKLLKYIVYQFAKLLVRLSYRAFFSEIKVINKRNMQADGATILVSNHPNTLIDVLNIAKIPNRVVHFLANAGLFSTPIGNAFFNFFFAIPIERPQDVEGRQIKNEDSFRRCDEFLSDGGCLYIAPEGGSRMHRHLRKVKTGTARIALSAESKNDFQLGLKIIPAGITYNAPDKFRSTAVVVIGEPIVVADFKNKYLENNRKTVQEITELIRDRIAQGMIDATGEEEDEFLKKIEKIQNTEKLLPTEQEYYRSRKTLLQLQEINKNNPSDYKQLYKEVNGFSKELAQHNITVENLKSNSSSFLSTFAKTFFLIIGLPFFLFGYLTNIIPATIPIWIFKKLNIYIGYTSTVKIIFSLITFPIFYAMQIILVNYLFANFWITLVYAIALIPLGYFAFSYLKKAKAYRQEWKFENFKRKNEEYIKVLIAKKQSILNKLNELIKSPHIST